MSSTEEGAGAVGAVSTNQTIINTTTTNNPPETIIQITGTDFTRSNGDPYPKPLIQSVPSTLGHHEDFKKYFKPNVISIGPLHHDNPAFCESEKLKLKLEVHFGQNIGIDMDTLYNNMKTEIDGLKKCYHPKELEKYSKDDEKLARMFFVDGCAILQAVYVLHGEDIARTSDLFLKNELFTFVYSDLFLLENQLPFRVLELLTRSSENGQKFMKAIIRFIDSTVKEPQSHQQDSEWWPQKEGERIHLLHLLRVRLLFNKDKKENPWRYSRFWTPLFMNLIYCSSQTRTKWRHSDTFRRIKDLKNAGIRLKASETSCLTDISFNRFFFLGKLQLPPITVDNSTMNLIAYELCPDFYNNFAVTSYMGFLDSLIDEAEDVKELRDAGILYNRLGSDKEVAKLIKKMNMDLVPSPMVYSHVKRQINNYRNNMWFTILVYHTCFRTRWTFFAFVGSIAALFIGALQTYYTIHQPNQGSSSHKH